MQLLLGNVARLPQNCCFKPAGAPKRRLSRRLDPLPHCCHITEQTDERQTSAQAMYCLIHIYVLGRFFLHFGVYFCILSLLLLTLMVLFIFLTAMQSDLQ